MKTILLNLLLFFFGTGIFAQGFVRNGTNLFLVNSSGSAILTPFPKVGLVTSTPSAQLHTTQSVRFQGLTNNNALTRVIVSDVNGNLSFRDTNIITGNFWALTGNSITSTDFIGTTNTQPFVIKTNNIEKMRITPTDFYRYWY